ncbi:unnamed protein product [Mycetohabitans rhizoxinica HKI 454]|uniref:Uncharacterized protein n=1 Tax=Mycetohabitans rhizoxinica (strain DSM 19002 / CIP 109453 / HKI 454) TaxID=882378 RepID=E5AS62_MYCRK|nr:unnamed protein product [Mycetohabitans rhizoxinica HKI 454]
MRIFFADSDYWLTPEAVAAAEAASLAAAAALEAASLAAAAAPEAAMAASKAAEAAAGADAAAASLAAVGAVLSSFLPQAARAITANRDATRRDFFMITSFYGYR